VQNLQLFQDWEIEYKIQNVLGIRNNTKMVCVKNGFICLFFWVKKQKYELIF